MMPFVKSSRLFADYFGEVEHPYVLEKEEEEQDETVA
jgi:hypothetical protein